MFDSTQMVQQSKESAEAVVQSKRERPGQKGCGAYNLTVGSIIAIWLDFEAKGMDWRRIGPDDLSTCSADFRAKLEETVWCCRVCDDAFTRIKAGRDFIVLRSYLLHTRHFGRTDESFWLCEAGGVLNRAVERFERCVAASAQAIKRGLEVEGA